MNVVNILTCFCFEAIDKHFYYKTGKDENVYLTAASTGSKYAELSGNVVAKADFSSGLSARTRFESSSSTGGDSDSATDLPIRSSKRASTRWTVSMLLAPNLRSVLWFLRSSRDFEAVARNSKKCQNNKFREICCCRRKPLQVSHYITYKIKRAYIIKTIK